MTEIISFTLFALALSILIGQSLTIQKLKSDMKYKDLYIEIKCKYIAGLQKRLEKAESQPQEITEAIYIDDWLLSESDINGYTVTILDDGKANIGVDFVSVRRIENEV